jgi:predicted Na+-dependent transporter
VPDIATPLEKLSLLVFLTGSSMSAGFTLDPKAVATSLRDGRFVGFALTLNFLLAPALAWLLVSLIPLERGLADGLLLLGGAAGAPFLPKLLEIAKCDLAKGIALMALLNAATIVFLTLVMPRLIPSLAVDPWGIARPLLIWIVAPLLAGGAVKAIASDAAARLAPLLAKAGTLALLVFFVLLVSRNTKGLLGLIGSGTLLAAALHAGLLFAAGWWLGGPRTETRGVLGLGTGARNFGAALVPASSSLRDPQVMLMLVASAVAGCIVSFSAAAWVKRRVA